MIIDFSVQNFRSIKEIQTLSFVATGLKSANENSFIDTNNIFEEAGNRLFKTIGIYGANASGKSNIIKALDYFVKAISAQPSNTSDHLKPLCQPFLFQENSDKTESFFQITLLIKATKYRYGFTIKRNPHEKTLDNATTYSNEVVTNEWLYADKSKNMSPLFIREDNHIKINKLQSQSKIPTSLPYRHTLFLAHASAFDADGDCNKISTYLRGLFTANFEIYNDKFRWLSISHLEQNDIEKNRFMTLLSSFGLSYSSIELEQDAKEKYDGTSIFPQDKIFLKKEFMEQPVSLNLKYNESSGTQKMFDLIGLLLRAFFSVRDSAVIVIDEIDSNFHPSFPLK